MSEPASKNRRAAATKEKNRGGRRKKVSMDPIDPSTDIFRTYNSWEEVPYELQCIPENARKAFKRYWIRDFKQVPLVVQQDKDFIRVCIIENLRSGSYGYEKPPKRRSKRLIKVHESAWNELPDEWKLDWQVGVAALRFRRANWKDIPEPLKSQDDFMRKAVLKRPGLLPLMPDRIQNDIDLWVKNIHVFQAMPRQMLEKNPSLRDDPQFWLKVVKNGRGAEFDLFKQYASPNIRQNREIMLVACTKGRYYYTSLLCPPLSQDEEFLREMCKGCRVHYYLYNIACIPFESQRLFPHLLIEFLFADYYFRDHYYHRDLHPRVNPELWSNLEFSKAWLQHGGSYLKEDFPAAWSSDPDLFLWIAKECPNANCLQAFQCSTETLRSDKSFMMKALDLDPWLFEAATAKLKNDIDIQMLVYSHQIFENNELALENLGIDHMGWEIDHYAQEKMKAYDGFMSFLCCVKCDMTSEKPIALLNQGPTTSMAYYRLVAEYLEVPTGLKLKYVRQFMDLSS